MNTKETLLKKYWIFILVLTLVSAGFGFVLGGLAELLYPLENAKGIGWQTGLIFGFIVGICYSISLGKLYNNVKQGKSFVGYGVLMGIIAGVICSTSVHTALMVAYEKSKFFRMGIGALFGIGAGALLGLISSAIFKKCYKTIKPTGN